MDLTIEPSADLQAEVRRLATMHINDALAHLDGISTDPQNAAEHIHEIRKRTKEVRGLCRLTLARHPRRLTRIVRPLASAARSLGDVRDAQVIVGTIDEIEATNDDASTRSLRELRASQEAQAEQALDDIAASRTALDVTATNLRVARNAAAGVKLENDFATMAVGLERIYRRGRAALAIASVSDDDDDLHEWRKATKDLWYAERLLYASAPGLVGPTADLLDELCEILGDDHDRSVLIDRLESNRKRYGGKKAIRPAVRIVRDQQRAARRDAFRIGQSIFAEKPRAFVSRHRSYWDLTRAQGPEPRR